MCMHSRHRSLTQTSSSSSFRRDRALSRRERENCTGFTTDKEVRMVSKVWSWSFIMVVIVALISLSKELGCCGEG